MRLFTYCRILIGLCECNRLLAQPLSAQKRIDTVTGQRNLRQLLLDSTRVSPHANTDERNKVIFRFVDDKKGAKEYARTH